MSREQSLPSLLGLRREELAEALAEIVDRPYRVDQIYRALYERGIESFSAMTDLAKDLRGSLAERFTIARPEIASRHRSDDGTVKTLLRLADDATIETVDIPERDRRTLCVSSQAGCALACRFCVTGYWGAGRDLTAGEIVSQVLIANASPSDPQATRLNLVFMGMGEPLLNLGNLRAAVEILCEQIPWRRITVSTAGVVPGLEALASWTHRPLLAISLHAPDDRRRSELMPINRRYPLAELMAALRRYPLRPRERITFEYILIAEWNDSPDDADALARRIQGIPGKVNLIPLNPDPVLDDTLRRPSPQRVTAFRERLRERGVIATVRRQRGDDVSAACGQLRASHREPRGFRRSNLSL